MNRNIPIVIAILAGVLTQCHSQPYLDGMDTETPPPGQVLEATLQKWPKGPKAAARMMIEKYGKPDQFSAKTVVWYYNRPWQQTEVCRDCGAHRRFRRDKDFIKQTVSYDVPNDKIDELKRFDKNIAVDTVRGELSARTDSESMTYLVLNLANDIITDKRSAEEARAFYLKTRRLAMSGKTSPYLDRFLFDTPAAVKYF